MPIAPRPPSLITLSTLSASAVGGSFPVDLQMCDRATVHFNGVTVTSAGTSAAKVQCSADGINWSDVAGATASLTGTGVNFAIHLGQLDSRYYQVVIGTPSAGAITCTTIIFVKGITNGY